MSTAPTARHNIVPELRALAAIDPHSEESAAQLVRLHALPPAHLSLVITYAEQAEPPNAAVRDLCGSIALARLCLPPSELYQDDTARKTLKSIANTAFRYFDVHSIR